MNLYFIAIETPPELTTEIRQFQFLFKELYQSERQLKIPVHITLIPPFKANEKQIDKLNPLLKAFSSHQKPFEIKLNDFGNFRKSVIYVAVEKSKNLLNFYSNLVQTLVNSNILELPPLHENFNPHITLANRDLSSHNYKLAWEEFKQKNFEASFQLDKIILYKHDGKRWQVKEAFKFKKHLV